MFGALFKPDQLLQKSGVGAVRRKYEDFPPSKTLKCVGGMVRKVANGHIGNRFSFLKNTGSHICPLLWTLTARSHHSSNRRPAQSELADPRFRVELEKRRVPLVGSGF